MYINIVKYYYKEILSIGQRNFYTASMNLRKPPDPGIKLKEKNWQLEFHQIVPESLKGKPKKIYGKHPIKVKVKKGKTYRWCSCGHSNTQPFCDYTHLQPLHKIRHVPLYFKAPDNVDMWFCVCKQTKNPPFCDGSHRSKEVQDAVKH